jgi:proliferating cell nuclear antigen
MKIVITENNKCDLFINIFQNIKVFSDIFSINFKNETLYIQGMDNNHVSIFEINLHKSWFNAYELEEEITIGINSTIFPKILSMWTRDHNIILSITNNDKLDISFEKVIGESEYNKYFEMPLVDIETEMLEIPDQEYTMDLEFDSKKIKKLIDELSVIGEEVNFKCNEEEINAITESIEGSMTVNIPFEDIENYSIEENETINLRFSLKFIKNMCLFNKISPTVTINFTNGIPMQFKYNMTEDSYVRFYLAPQIDDN